MHLDVQPVGVQGRGAGLQAEGAGRDGHSAGLLPDAFVVHHTIGGLVMALTVLFEIAAHALRGAWHNPTKQREKDQCVRPPHPVGRTALQLIRL